ncbi:DUF2523 family protein [Kingella negevensis]|uniref:DUF2523 family protein n=1 Tax=Kingella negevensis TaxID=1522312 RepID=UPI00050A2EA9|nr:DUF2523 family protein [Kingella negevensis]MDK4680562.1 DUF2523 family protein [Kingella negevensis]MDK4681715.1 DUF2523 family protein [Kingella negevensis]MDK4689913.1 DUF2523 family protein [Kingella negevensis]MDK4692743.1 DUF2523 family protein [Kingella negevensis]MDK4699042.1 DUF2523 family protein [Kingella negevensis]
MALPLIPIISTAIVTALTSSVGKLAIQALTSIGFGYVMYQGFDVLMIELNARVSKGLSDIPYSLLALLSISGFLDGIQIMLGGMGVAVSLMITQRMAFFGVDK